MWLMRMPSTTCWVVMAGMPVRTVPLRSSSASESARTPAAATAAPFSWSATVSALVQPACSRAWVAFISSSIAVVKFGIDLPAAMVFTIPRIASCPRAR